MRNASLRRIHRKEGAFNVFAGLLVEAIFVFFPMACMAVVLYDISLNGMHSVFAVIGVGIVSTWAVFRSVTFCMGKYDGLIDRLHERRRARRHAP
ncbi:hypothetical protein OIU34_23945 [Pararhizobium sp. BT-229]|uniref:hypothetical protein n=1 Tax=Pararhizobium sp. BT-229 TaxID=2986923 RepID=UPI0021F75190|nr:hypothetical protein [Pararhizobium sp. BT-229]MCV9964951.1 hypothetical protein [Pararhizobium sp. BT-229]